MTRGYHAGELSVLLEDLGAVAPGGTAAEIGCLRCQAEDGPATGLTPVITVAVAVADSLCCGSLSRGDADAFAGQALAASRPREFAVCSLLMADGWPARRHRVRPHSRDGPFSPACWRVTYRVRR